MEAAGAAMDDGEERIIRRRRPRRGPRILSPKAQMIYDGVNEMRKSDPERFKTLMEELNPKPVKPPQYDPEVLKRCMFRNLYIFVYNTTIHLAYYYYCYCVA